MKKESFGIKSYLKQLTFSEARISFKHKSQMFEAKRNYKNKREYESTNWLCDSCETKIDSNSHVTWKRLEQ